MIEKLAIAEAVHAAYSRVAMLPCCVDANRGHFALSNHARSR